MSKTQEATKMAATPHDLPSEFFQSIARLRRDIKTASVTLSDREARFLVDAYYQMQRDRIRAGHQERTLTENAEPHDVLAWLGDQRSTLEKQIAGALDVYSNSLQIGRWARSITGIGPIIAAGLVSNIDIKRAPTVGHIWRFAGLDPTVVWKANTKRPWNGALKRLCFLIGESFTKVSGRESDVYGKVYVERKALEMARNEAGAFAEQAAASLAAKKWRDDTKARAAYEAGRLPQARIHLRAQRYATKLFLSHYHHVAYEIAHGAPPAKPYILAKGDPLHTDFIGPPNWPMSD
ncbi:MAG TPA: transposase [Hyphomicrobiaceae bacterium]|nr:transposase [Hyphomicrobiaceae bacterium]